MKGELHQSGVPGRKMGVLVKGSVGTSDSSGQLQATRQPGVRKWGWDGRWDEMGAVEES